MIYFLVLAGMAKKVFKTGAFNRSAIPPSPILSDSFILRGVSLCHYFVTGGLLLTHFPAAEISPLKSKFAFPGEREA
jgi:hypothetical protein